MTGVAAFGIVRAVAAVSVVVSVVVFTAVDDTIIVVRGLPLITIFLTAIVTEFCSEISYAEVALFYLSIFTVPIFVSDVIVVT